MSNFAEKLRLSVSLAALVGAGSFAAGTARASATVTGTQTMVAITTNVTGDVNVASTGVVSPLGMSITGTVTGDVINDGLVEGVLSNTSAWSSLSTSATQAGLGVYNTVDGEVQNNGTINGGLVANVAVEHTSGVLTDATGGFLLGAGLVVIDGDGGIAITVRSMVMRSSIMPSMQGLQRLRQ